MYKFSCLLEYPALKCHGLGHPVLNSRLMFIHNNTACVYWYMCLIFFLLEHPLLKSSRVNWDTLYLILMFIETSCTKFPCLLVHPVLNFHVYWDTEY